MKIPTRKYKIQGLPIPDELTAIGILGFLLDTEGVQVTTADNCLTIEQVEAVADFLTEFPHHHCQEEIRQWAKEHFYLDGVIDPFGLIKLSQQDD